MLAMTGISKRRFLMGVVFNSCLLCLVALFHTHDIPYAILIAIGVVQIILGFCLYTLSVKFYSELLSTPGYEDKACYYRILSAKWSYMKYVYGGLAVTFFIVDNMLLASLFIACTVFREFGDKKYRSHRKV